MSKLVWDKAGERYYETGVKNGVLYVKTGATYGTGVAWNGLTAITESPSGAEATPLYADDMKYLNLISAEEFGATIEAYTYPDEFAACDGSAALGGIKGVMLGQQKRSTFGLCYRTTVGNDEDLDAYKLHIIYNCLAAPSEKAYATINDSPEAITFSWEVTTTPEAVGSVNGVEYKPTSIITIDSSKLDTEHKEHLAKLEEYLYGSATAEASLPTPAQVYSIMSAGTLPEA